ncbi:MAG: phosphatase PAP2 family protein [Polyangiaceae bacterium]
MGDDMWNDDAERTGAALSPVAVVAPAEWALRFVKNLAAQDWLLVAYFTILTVAIACGNGPDRGEAMRMALTDAGIFLSVLLLVRGEMLKTGTFATLLYRATIITTVVASYFQLRTILPAVTTHAVDGQLLAFDLRVFGFEPSLAWDKYVTPTTTEWFAFFYYSYFFLLSAHVLAFVLLCRDADFLARFAFGIFLVFCVAHLLYMAVPGYGPYKYSANEFRHELTGGVCWHLVRSAVDTAGAQKDIFPSLHTAVPTYCFIFSFRHRHVRPLTYTWPVVAFFASQIIVATMFLRWHWLVDICAGITLATISALLCERVQPWESARRARFGVQPVFAPFSLLGRSAVSATSTPKT